MTLSYHPFLLSLFLSCWALPSAVADDELVMQPGTECQVLSGTATFTDFGDVENRSTTTPLRVLCPITRVDNNSVFSGRAYVIDRNTTLNVTCTPYANTNGTIYSGTQQTTSGSANTYKVLSFSDPAVSYTYTSRYLVCTLPVAQGGGGWSSLMMYRSQQNP